MNQKRNLRLFIFRYHLIPVTSEDRQHSLFGEKMNLEEIKKRKNDFFKEAILELDDIEGKYPIQIYDHEKDSFLLRIAQKKSQTVTKNFKREYITNEPYCYVIINNDKGVQKIAISENPNAFSNPDVVKNILGNILQKLLLRYQLNIEIEQLFDVGTFWNYLELNKGAIKSINFEFIKPNLADISKSLTKNLKDFTNAVNSHKSNIIVKAPDQGYLENIDKKNIAVKGLVDYSSEGGGNIKVKVKGLKKYLKTKDSPKTLTVKELDLEGTPDQIIKLYKELLKS